MNRSEVAQTLRAFSADELLGLYRRGRRDFSRSNLLCIELEATVREHRHLDCADHPAGARYNPLWMDYRFGVEKDFEWDRYGRCLSVDESDFPEPRRLAGAVLKSINLSGSYLYPVDLTGTDLSASDLRNAIFVDCVLSDAKVARADLRNAQFLDCKLDGADFYMARMDRVLLAGCDARRANFGRAKLRRAHFAGVDLRNSQLRNAHCELITLAGDLRGIDLKGLRLNAGRVGESTISARQIKPLLAALAIDVK